MSIILIIGVHIDRLANAHRAIRQCSHLGPPAVKSSLKAFSADCITSKNTRHDGRHFCVLQPQRAPRDAARCAGSGDGARHRRLLREGHQQKLRTSLEIVLGQIEVPARKGEVFAVVRHLDGLAKERVKAAMRRCGRTPDTVVTALSDSEDGMRTMLGRWLDPTVKHRLDWWYLYRRLEKMREGLIYLLLVPGEEAGSRLRAEAWGVEHIRWTLWNGGPCVYSTDCAINSFRIDLEMHRRAAHSAGRAVERIDCMLERLEEFRRYLYANSESLVNYNHARIAASGYRRHTLNRPSISWSTGGCARSSRCAGRPLARSYCFTCAPPT